MGWTKTITILGWLIALVAVALSVFLALMLRDMRAEKRMATVQRVPVLSATVLPPEWSENRRRILLVGDSRIAEWESLPQGPGVVFATSGIGGETTGQLERRFERDVLGIASPPDDIVLAIGINDLVAASLQRDYAAAIQREVSDLVVNRLKGLAADARQAGIDVSIATVIQPAAPDLVRRLTFWDDNLYALVRDVNDQIQALDGQDGVRVLDFNAVLEGGAGPLPMRFSTDTLHFNETAYKTLGAYLLKEYPAS